MNLYAKSEDIHKKIVMAVIITIWIIGIIIAVVHKMREWNKVKGYLIKGTSEGDGVAEKILREIDSECPIKIEYNLAIAEPFIKGLRHPVIYLPEKECNEKELEFILMHEYLHWKRKDLWKKFIINIIGMIFWWNPLAYLLCKDLDQIIELNCDNAMSKKYSEMDTLYYLDTLTYMAGGRRANFDEVSSNTLGFVKKLEVRPLKQRFHYVMFKKDDKRTQRKMNLFILGVSVIWFVAS
ncbi:M56 family metallopeptidase [Anaerobutyricum hallii]|uniref:M56 family metallopeptidase n=1 Tax=Anaerobutyricum hallii TaxID=39488 RepID=UPI00399D1712